MKKLAIALALGMAASPALAIEHGSALLQERCAACHDLTGPAAKSLTELKARKGPDLFYAGNKYRADWLAGWLRKPSRIRPAGVFYLDHIKPGAKQDEIDGTTLKPHLALNADDAATAAKALMGLKANGELLQTKPFVTGPSPLGEMSFDKFYGCMACHEIEPGFGGKTGPEVYTAGRRLAPEFMVSFIRNPQAWNPKGLMPNKHVPEVNIPKLVNFMLELAKEDWK
ncbi:MAG: c-type cytochrome [Rhodospirillales bacterium]|nr:c-type cytochrome [Rhodospirillales bacterium]